jgi:hypothetical protein
MFTSRNPTTAAGRGSSRLTSTMTVPRRTSSFRHHGDAGLHPPVRDLVRPRNAAIRNGDMEQFGVIGSIDDRTVTFVHNFDHSDAAFPEVFGRDPFAAPDYMSDYDQSTSDKAFFYTRASSARWSARPAEHLAGPRGRSAARITKCCVSGRHSRFGRCTQGELGTIKKGFVVCVPLG